MTYLLDVNVLIALLDSSHIGHDTAHDWFADRGKESWATCPLTENGAVRVLSQKSYPNALASPAVAIEYLREFCSVGGHAFWPDRLSILNATAAEAGRILSPAQITDTYLLALASANGGLLATLDRRLVTDAVANGRKHLHLVGRA